VVLEIKDAGNGIPPKVLEELGDGWPGSLGVGLRGMHERIRQLHGVLEISSSDKGTVVRAAVPASKEPGV
jgi:signal transduction histidine kinase